VREGVRSEGGANVPIFEVKRTYVYTIHIEADNPDEARDIAIETPDANYPFEDGDVEVFRKPVDVERLPPQERQFIKYKTK
jgi:hypothetical protein